MSRNLLTALILLGFLADPVCALAQALPGSSSCHMAMAQEESRSMDCCCESAPAEQPTSPPAVHLTDSLQRVALVTPSLELAAPEQTGAHPTLEPFARVDASGPDTYIINCAFRC